MVDSATTGLAFSIGSNQLSGFVKGLDRLTNEEEPEMEDPEVVAARQEQEHRRKEKHRKMEADRERMRQAIRDKYHLKKKEEPREQDIAGRIAGNRKTPEQVAMESMNDEEDDGFMAMLNETYEKAKNTVVSAYTSVTNAVGIWRGT
uniref:Putative complexin-1 n=1 Tax=Caenorhabditis japonica TaxID=281687 RepID=A0A8R1DNP0_CAEJA